MTDQTEKFPAVYLHHATRAKAAKLAELLRAEYPRLQLLAIGSDSEFRGDLPICTGWVVTVNDPEIDDLGPWNGVPLLADVLEACEEAGIDPEEAPEEEEMEDEEERAPSSVVPERYREKYALASTTGVSCGDWLAEWLAATVLTGKGSLIVDDFRAICEHSGVDLTGKWARPFHTEFGLSRGWQGRVRMSGRQQLEKVIAIGDTLHGPDGAPVDVPSDFRAEMASRHAAYVKKEAKRRAALEADEAKDKTTSEE